jgi:hypothetical protein
MGMRNEFELDNALSMGMRNEFDLDNELSMGMRNEFELDDELFRLRVLDTRNLSNMDLSMVSFDLCNMTIVGKWLYQSSFAVTV